MHLKNILAPFFGFLLGCSIILPAFPQTDNDPFLASMKSRTSTQSSENQSDIEVNYSELAPGHNSAFQFQPNSRTLQLIHRLPKYTTHALVYIMDLTGRILKRIILDPKDKGGSKIYLHDLLAGNYLYLLVLDSGRKIPGGFELKD